MSAYQGMKSDPMRYMECEREHDGRAGVLVLTDGCGEDRRAAVTFAQGSIDGGMDGAHRTGREIARRWEEHQVFLAFVRQVATDSTCYMTAAGAEGLLQGFGKRARALLGMDEPDELSRDGAP